MNPRYRIYAAVGGLGVLLLLAFFMLVGHGSGAAASPAPTIKPLHPVKKTAVRTRRAALARKRAKATVSHVKTRAKPAARAKTPLAPPKVAKTDGATDGMPAALSAALAQHNVVVVSLVVPGAQVDEMAYAEAKAGAAQARAGFVRISAASNDDVQALSTLIDSNADSANRLLDAPAVLIFRKPHDLYVRINGYVDAPTIAQAAANAAPTAPAPTNSASRVSPWVRGANALCIQIHLQLASEATQTNGDLISYVQKFVDTAKAGIDKIRVLKPPAGKSARVHAMLDAYDRTFADAHAALAAVRRHDVAAYQTYLAKVKTEGAEGDAIAAELGATACSESNR